MVFGWVTRAPVYMVMCLAMYEELLDCATAKL